MAGGGATPHQAPRLEAIAGSRRLAEEGAARRPCQIWRGGKPLPLNKRSAIAGRREAGRRGEKRERRGKSSLCVCGNGLRACRSALTCRPLSSSQLVRNTVTGPRQCLFLRSRIIIKNKISNHIKISVYV